MKMQSKKQFEISLLQYSSSDNYNTALKEWFFEYAYIEDSKCICGVKIKKCCVIKNEITNKELVVGSTCVDKFLNIDTTKEFKELNERTKYTYSYIEDLHGRNKISDWEATFLVSLLKFTVLSPKQKEWFNKIDKKIKSGKSYVRYN